MTLKTEICSYNTYNKFTQVCRMRYLLPVIYTKITLQMLEEYNFGLLYSMTVGKQQGSSVSRSDFSMQAHYTD